MEEQRYSEADAEQQFIETVLDLMNEAAEEYPLGWKEYWRTQIVGHWHSSIDGDPLDNEQFEAAWERLGFNDE